MERGKNGEGESRGGGVIRVDGGQSSCLHVLSSYGKKYAGKKSMVKAGSRL